MDLKIVQPDARDVLPANGCVVGIDVGWAEVRHSSSICILKWSDEHIEIEFPRSTERIMNFRFRKGNQDDAQSIAEFAVTQPDNPPLVVAIDGPLGVQIDTPPDVYRRAEEVLSRGEFQDFGRPGSASSTVGKILARQTALVAQAIWQRCQSGDVQKNDLLRGPVVEAFPNAFLASLLSSEHREQARVQFAQHPNWEKSDVYYKLLSSEGLPRLLKRLLPRRKFEIHLARYKNHDQRAALVCALTALCVAAREFAFVGETNQGVIVLPPPETEATNDGMTAWAQNRLGIEESAGVDESTPRKGVQPPSNPVWYDFASSYLNVARPLRAGKLASGEAVDHLRKSLLAVNLEPASAYRIALQSQDGPVEGLKAALGLPLDLQVDTYAGARFLGLAHDLAINEHPLLGNFWGGGTPSDTQIADVFLPFFGIIRSLENVALSTAKTMFALLLERVSDRLR